MNKFDKKIEKLFDERFGETLSDELQKVRDKLTGSEESEEMLAISEPVKLNEELYNEDDEEVDTDEEETEVFDDETEESNGSEISDGDEDEDDEGSKETEDEGFDVASIYDEVVSSFEDLSDTELEYEIHLARQQMFDLEDQFGPNSDEYIGCFIKTRVAYQKLNSGTVTPDADAFTPIWTV